MNRQNQKEKTETEPDLARHYGHYFSPPGNEKPPMMFEQVSALDYSVRTRSSDSSAAVVLDDA